MGKGPLTDVVDLILQDLRTGVKLKRATLQEAWPRIVGPSLAAHTKGTLQRGNTLCVWVDDSVTAYEISRRHQGTILKRAQEASRVLEEFSKMVEPGKAAAFQRIRFRLYELEKESLQKF